MGKKYKCLDCSIELDESVAEQASYRCPDCGSALSDDQTDTPTTKGERSKVFLTVCALLALVVAGFFIWQSSSKKSGGPTATISKAQAIEQVIQKALEINSKTPMMIDDSTRLDQVVVKEKTIVYKATLVELTAEKWNKELFNKEIDRFLADKYCNDSKARQTLELGVLYDHEYFGVNGSLLYTANIGLDDC